MSISSPRSQRRSEIPESKNNILVDIDDVLVDYARELEGQDWDPNTPRLTQEESDFLSRTKKKGAETP